MRRVQLTSRAAVTKQQAAMNLEVAENPDQNNQRDRNA
jgi:hypothetical protein